MVIDPVGAAKEALRMTLRGMACLLAAAMLVVLAPAATAEVTVGEADWIGGTKLVVLENEHLRAEIAPAYGGRLFQLTHKPAGVTVLHKTDLDQLPDLDKLVAQAEAAMREYRPQPAVERWALSGSVYGGHPDNRWLSGGWDTLCGWLECMIDRPLGPDKGNEQYLARWDHQVRSVEGGREVVLTYVTRLPPAPLKITKSFRLMPGESRLRIRHVVTNGGDKPIPFEYFSHCNFTPGGEFDDRDRFVVPVRGPGDVLTAQLRPNQRIANQCFSFRPADRWVGYLDGAGGGALVHRFGFDAGIAWTWEGKDHCSLEPVRLDSLAPGEETSWEQSLNLARDMPTLTGVRGDWAIGIGPDQAEFPVGEAVELAISVVSFAPGPEKATVELSITPVGDVHPAIAKKLTFSGLRCGRGATRTWRVPADQVPANCVVTAAAGDCIARKVVRVGRSAKPRRDNRPILFLGSANSQIITVPKAYLKMNVRRVANLDCLRAELLDPQQFRALVVFDVGNLLAVDEQQAREIADYVRAGGRLVLGCESTSNWSVDSRIPPSGGYRILRKLVPIEPDDGLPISPNYRVRDNFRVDASSVADHPLTRGLPWKELEIGKYYRHEVREGASVLVRLDTGDPLLVAAAVGRGNVVMFTGGLEFTARRWAQFGKEADELLRRMIDGYEHP